MILNPVKHIKQNFTFDFFLERQISPFYNELTNATNNTKWLSKNSTFKNTVDNVLHEIKNIPYYINLNNSVLSPHYKVIRYKRIKNYIIDLQGYSDVNEYLLANITRKNIKKLKTRKNRLEKCFNITYKSYFGDISKQKYEYLFHEFKQLIDRRFRQRGDQFYPENKWNYYVNVTYQLILDKKASFYVIYDDEKPIHISLMYHFQNIALSFINSYDIDYSKFGIGHVAIFKKIEWLLQDNIDILDLMWGGTIATKLEWCNNIRKYEHQFIFRNSNRVNEFYTNLILKLYKVKDELDEKSKAFKKIKRSILERYQHNTNQRPLNYKIESIDESAHIERLTKINLENNQFAFLRKPVYDFQYSNSENSNNIVVFKDNINDNIFFVKGTKSQIKVMIDHNL